MSTFRKFKAPSLSQAEKDLKEEKAQLEKSIKEEQERQERLIEIKWAKELKQPKEGQKEFDNLKNEFLKLIEERDKVIKQHVERIDGMRKLRDDAFIIGTRLTKPELGIETKYGQRLHEYQNIQASGRQTAHLVGDDNLTELERDLKKLKQIDSTAKKIWDKIQVLDLGISETEKHNQAISTKKHQEIATMRKEVEEAFTTKAAKNKI